MMVPHQSLGSPESVTPSLSPCPSPAWDSKEQHGGSELARQDSTRVQHSDQGPTGRELPEMAAAVSNSNLS